ncbi:MAG: cytochrome c [Candidatus Binatia bacterium]
MYRLRIRKIFFSGLFTMALVGIQAQNGLAQEQEVAAAGKIPYNQSCASCHGEGGKGNGMVASILMVKPTDLTQLSKKSEGTFPFWRVYGVIDGREEIKGHGLRDMPVWGQVFRSQAATSPVAESVVRGRILELVYYIQSLQEK